jgi:hypothetical protein
VYLEVPREALHHEPLLGHLLARRRQRLPRLLRRAQVPLRRHPPLLELRALVGQLLPHTLQTRFLLAQSRRARLRRAHRRRHVRGEVRAVRLHLLRRRLGGLGLQALLVLQPPRLRLEVAPAQPQRGLLLGGARLDRRPLPFERLLHHLQAPVLLRDSVL